MSFACFIHGEVGDSLVSVDELSICDDPVLVCCVVVAVLSAKDVVSPAVPKCKTPSASIFQGVVPCVPSAIFPSAKTSASGVRVKSSALIPKLAS